MLQNFCRVCITWSEMRVDYRFNLHTRLKCQRESLSKSILSTQWGAQAPCICIMCLVFPDRPRAFPSDAHRFSLHVLSCNKIFEFKEWCYALGEITPCCGHYSTNKCGELLQCYPVTNVCSVHCSVHTTLPRLQQRAKLVSFILLFIVLFNWHINT